MTKSKVIFLPPMPLPVVPTESPLEAAARAAEVAHEDLVNATPTPFAARWRTDHQVPGPTGGHRVAAGQRCVVLHREIDDRLDVATFVAGSWLVAYDVRARRIDLA